MRHFHLHAKRLLRQSWSCHIKGGLPRMWWPWMSLDAPTGTPGGQGWCPLASYPMIIARSLQSSALNCGALAKGGSHGGQKKHQSMHPTASWSRAEEALEGGSGCAASWTHPSHFLLMALGYFFHFFGNTFVAYSLHVFVQIMCAQCEHCNVLRDRENF